MKTALKIRFYTCTWQPHQKSSILIAYVWLQEPPCWYSIFLTTKMRDLYTREDYHSIILPGHIFNYYSLNYIIQLFCIFYYSITEYKIHCQFYWVWWLANGLLNSGHKNAGATSRGHLRIFLIVNRLHLVKYLQY